MDKSERLRGYLLDPQVGALLVADPTQYPSADERQLAIQSGSLLAARNGTPRIVFKLPSGRCTNYFLSFWEVFDNDDVYSSFLDAFEEAAARLYTDPQTTYDAIATSTPTSKHILDSLLSRLHDRGIQIDHYLLDQLPLSDHDARLPDLTRSRVLILTDVISTGSLIRKLAGAVRRLDGVPVAVLGGVQTQPDLASLDGAELGGTGFPVPIVTLTHLSLPDSLSDPSGHSEFWPVDPFKVFPEEQGVLLHKHLRSSCELVRDLEAANAIRFGFFKADWHRVFTAVHVPRFLDCHAEEIWGALGDQLLDTDLLVTTHSRAELLLKRSLSSRLPTLRAKWLLLPSKGSPEGPEAHFLLPKHKELIAQAGDKTKATVLFFSVQTAERLRDIVSLLATYGLRRVSVLSVIDRMPRSTAGFTCRLANLFRGESRDHRTAFSFQSLYYVREFDTATLVQLEEAAHQILRIYSEYTRSPSFSYEFAHDCKYFGPTSVTSQRFLAAIPESPAEAALFDLLQREAYLALEQYVPRTVDGQLTILLETILATRNYSLISEAIAGIAGGEERQPREKEWLFTLFGVILADIHYIKRTHHFTNIRTGLLNSISAIRIRRFSYESEGGPDIGIISRVAREVEREADLALLLGLMAFFDTNFDYLSEINLFISQGLFLEAGEAEKNPVNVLCFYYNVRTVFACSLVLLLGYPTIRKNGRGNGRAVQTLQDTLDRLRRLILHLEIPSPLCEGISSHTGGTLAKATDVVALTPIGIRRAMLDNLTLLENDLLLDRPRERHSVLRYLFRHILDPKRDHNPIWRNLDNGIQALDLLLASEGQAFVTESYDKNALEAAYRAAGLAEQVAGAARSFFHFHTASEDASAYTKKKDEDGLLALLGGIAEVLQDVRRSGLVTRRLAQRVIGDWESARSLLFPDGDIQPLLARELLGHLVALPQILSESLLNVKRSLGDEVPIPWDDWGGRLARGDIGSNYTKSPGAAVYSSVDEEGAPAIFLCECVLAEEIFTNVFANLAHLNETTSDPLLRNRVQLTIRRDLSNLDDERKEYWVVQLAWPAEIPVNPPGEGTTWKKHERQFVRYGGLLTFHADDGYCEVWCLARTASGGPPQTWIGRSEL